MNACATFTYHIKHFYNIMWFIYSSELSDTFVNTQLE